MYPKSPFEKSPNIEKLLHPKQTSCTQYLNEWLCITPKTTFVRVNLLKTTLLAVKEIISNVLCQQYKNASIKVFTIEQLPDVLCIGDYEGVVQPTIDTSSRVYVDRLCAAAILRGAHLYAPGVLSMTGGTKLNEPANIYTELGKTRLKGSKCTDKPTNTDIYLGHGIVRMQRHELFGTNAKTSGIAIEMTATRSGVPSLGDSFIPIGHGMLQNLPSIICGHVLSPQPNEVILDMCAAPGNKTTHLAELMQDTGSLIALDRSANKIRMMKRKINNFHLKSVRCFAFDSTRALDSGHRSNDGGDDANALRPPFGRGTFDRILLDAPCSGLGNRPQLEYNGSDEEFLSYPMMQRKLFRTAVELLKVGGVLVYSTCSVSCGENEDVVRWAIDEFSATMQLVAAEPIFGGPGWSGVGLSDAERVLVQRFGPEQDVLRIPDVIYRDSIGFFIAKFVKQCKNE